MKALFLDIDGVLTSARAHIALSSPHSRFLVWHHFDPVAIGFLNRLHDENEDLKVVLSSTWRLIYEMREMFMMLSQAGWRGEFHQNWKTASLGSCRGDEILAWCKEHKPDRYVILDDSSDMLPEQFNHFVLTSAQDGMNSLDHYTKAKECLKKKTNFGGSNTALSVCIPEVE